MPTAHLLDAQVIRTTVENTTGAAISKGCDEVSHEGSKLTDTFMQKNPSLLVQAQNLNGQQENHPTILTTNTGDQQATLALLCSLFPGLRQKEGETFLISGGHTGSQNSDQGMHNYHSMQGTLDHVNSTMDTHEGQQATGIWPSFEGPPRYKKANRASSRLRAKQGGRYISVVDKARANRGFINIAGLMQKVKIKKNKPCKPVPEYLKNFDPLTREHAQALLAAAGVGEDDTIQAQIEEALANPGGGMVPVISN
ncbi:hypothetical protein FCM35_KLT00389 [Carex littledalei]|uniref:Uncharacterized protein n=1 Tax=Carex littledalei TaxID=544730 RepID=A0A833RTY4_9POAL|nr:hypothetical protein FCM35_KLT00389 [Carex littledalei]